MMNKDIRDFLFRGLMFEAEAASFQAAGIQVGADIRDAEEHLLAEALTPFGVQRSNNGLEMARLYAVLFCFENEIRDFIRETLLEKEGEDWVDKLPYLTVQRRPGRTRVHRKDRRAIPAASRETRPLRWPP